MRCLSYPCTPERQTWGEVLFKTQRRCFAHRGWSGKGLLYDVDDAYHFDQYIDSVSARIKESIGYGDKCLPFANGYATCRILHECTSLQ